MADGLMEAPPSDVRLSAPDLHDPLGSLQFVKGTEYMDALARLGYNVENMTSPLPLMTKIAEAGSNLLDMGMQRRLENQKAQADLAYKTAQSRYTDSEAAYNEQALGNRLKLLQADVKNKQVEADHASTLADLGIQEKQRALDKQQFDLEQAKRNADAKATEDSARAQQQQIVSQEMQRTQQLDSDALNEWGSARNELPPIDDPNYDQKINEFYKNHPKLLQSEKTKPLVNALIEQGRKARQDNVDVQNTNAEMVALADMKAKGSVATDMDMNRARSDATYRHEQMTRGRIVSSQKRIDEIVAQVGSDAPTEIKTQVAQLYNAQTQLQNILSDPDGINKIKSGAYSRDLDVNGNLSGRLEGAISAVDFYNKERLKQGLGKPMATDVEHVTKDPITGETHSLKATNVPFELVPQVRQQLESLQAPAEGTPQAAAQPKAEQDRATQEAKAALAASANDPEIQALTERARVSGRTEDWQAVAEAIKRKARERTGKPQTGGQYGGLVTPGGINGPQTGLGRARGGLIPPAAATAGYGQGYQEGGTVNPLLGANADVAPNLTLGSTDTVAAMLTPGEFVLNAGAVKDIGLPMLEALNQSPSSEEAQSDVTNVATPLLLGEAAQAPPQMTGQSPIALPPVAQPGSGGEWPHVAPSPPQTQVQALAPRAEIAAPPVPAQTPAVTTGPATVDINKPLVSTGAPIGTEITGLATNFGHDVNGRPDTYMLSKLGPGARIGAFGTDVVNPSTVGVSLPVATIRANIGDPTNPAVRKAIQSGRYQVLVHAPNGRSGMFKIVDIGPGPNEPGKIDLTGSAMRQLGVNDSFNARFQVVDTQAPTRTYQSGGYVGGYQEGGFVINKDAVARIGLPILEALNRGDMRALAQLYAG